MSTSISWSLKYLAGLAAVLLCEVARAAGGDPPGSNSGQGIFLHGTGRFEHVNIPLVSGVLPQGGAQTGAQAPVLPGRSPTFPGQPRFTLCSMRIDRGELKEVCESTNSPPKTLAAGLALKGATFHAPFSGRFMEFTITDVAKHQAPAATGPGFQYKVRWKFQGTEGPLCPSRDGLTGLPIERFALAVPGAWTPSGELLETPDYFTFACLPGTVKASSSGGQASQEPPLLLGGGVIAKCINMGFPPWDGSSSATEQGHAAARDFHQMCVRMAMADYCSEGKANTIEGTPITFFASTTHSPLNVQTELDTKREKILRKALQDTAGKPTGYSLEAVWTVDPRSGKASPLCFGEKTRWKALALEGTCLDPTLRLKLMSGSSSGDWSCESKPLPELMKSKSLLVVYSLFLDKPLVRFEVKSGNGPSTFVTTSAATLQKSSTLAATFNPSFKLDLNVTGKAEQAMLEGPILSSEAPAGHLQKLQPLGLKPLYRCKQKNGKLYALTENCTALAGNYALDDNGDGGIEGYIFAKKVFADELPLKLWKHSDGRYLTTTVPPPLNQGWDKEPLVELGYLPTMSASRTWVSQTLAEAMKEQMKKIPPISDIPITVPKGLEPAPRPAP